MERLFISFLFFLVSSVFASRHSNHHYRPLNVQEAYGFGYGFRFATFFQSNMVLQREPHRAVLWGYGEAGKDVALRVGQGRTYHTKVAIDYKGDSIWKIILDPTEASGPYHITGWSKWRGEDVQIIIKNVMFGDVWVCGGQSNMAFTASMLNASDFQRELKLAGSYRDVRLFTVDRYFSDTPVFELDYLHILQHWMVASPDAIGGSEWQYFSALCWIYGRKLYDLYQIPIGLVSSNFGGTRVEAWSSHNALQSCGIDATEYNTMYRWKHPELEGLDDYFSDQNTAHVLWNAMITPLLNVTIKGVIWYQGESNANSLTGTDEHNPYDCSFPAMIADWRKKWSLGTSGSTDPQFPFGFVQLAPLFSNKTEFPLVRYEQTAGYSTVPNEVQPNVFMAVAMDLPDNHSPYGSIHPRDKTTIADRLILGARVIAYGEKGIDFQGPVLDECTLIAANFKYQVKISYRNLDENGLKLLNINGFEFFTISSEAWVPVPTVTKTADNQNILLDVPNKHVIAIRYAWKEVPCDYKQCAIYSVTDDLPSPPTICYLK